MTRKVHAGDDRRREGSKPLQSPPLSPRPGVANSFLTMRGLDDSTEVILRVGQSAGQRVRHAWEGFVNFAARDNVLEVALGLMLDSSISFKRTEGYLELTGAPQHR